MLKLIITAPNYNLPASYRDEDGFFSIPIPESVAASLNYDTAALSELGAIVSSFSNTFELIADQQTQNMLKRAHFRKNRQGLSAKLQGGLIMSGYYFPGLIVIERSTQNLMSGNVKYGIQFLGTHQTWKEAARKMSICQLDFGSIFNSAANVEASWDNDTYVPGGQPFYMPLVSKGPWLNPTYRIVEDFDFICVYLAHLLLDGFCKLGYTIESEFVNTLEFRKKAAYLLSDAYFNRDNINKFGEFRASLTDLITPPLIPGYCSNDYEILEQPSNHYNYYNILYNDDFTLPSNSDVNNLYLPATGEYSGYSGNVSFSASVAFSITPQDLTCVNLYPFVLENTPIIAKLEIKVTTAAGNNVFIAESAPIDISHSTITTISVQSGDVNLLSTDKVYVKLLIDRIPTFIGSWQVEISGGYFSSDPKNNIIQRDQLLIINELLNCEITLFSVLEDLTKLYNLQYYTNEPEKKVYIEPEYRWQDWAGLPHRGSRREIGEAYDISKMLNTPKDIGKDFTAESEKRYMQFLFSDGTDYHCVRYKEEQQRELHSSEKIDVGDTGNDVEEVRLSIFKPTQTIYDEAGYQDPYAIQVPAIWNAEPDTESGSPYPKERAYSLGGRVLHIHGMSVQQNKNGNLPVWYFEDTTPRNAYPKAYMVNKDNPSNSSIVFGSTITNKTQVSTFYKNLSAIKQALIMSAELTLRPNQVACFDTRYPVLFDSAKYPPEIAGYYFIKRLQILEIAKPVQQGKIDLIPLSFIQDCERLCNLAFDYTSSAPTVSGAEDGSITITDIEGYTGLVDLVVTNSEGEIIFTTSIDPLTDLPLVIPDLGGGVYLLSLTDESGCTYQQQIILSNPCETFIEAEGVNPSSEGATDGSITITGLTGMSYPVAVIVKLGAANVYSQSGVLEIDLPITVINLSAATYTVIVIDSAGCSTHIQIELSDTGECNHPNDFAIFSTTGNSITLAWTITVGNTYNIRWKLASELVWTTVTGVSPNLTILGLNPCLNYEFQIETLCDLESIGYIEDSIFGETDCPCDITFTVTPLEGAGISITDIDGLSEGASPIIIVTDCDGNPVPNWWEGVPECYKVCVIDSCTCCQGCQTSCFITLAEPEISECGEEVPTISVLIDISDTNLVGDLILYYSMDNITWFSGGLSTMGVGWLISDVPASGGNLYIMVQNPDDALCQAVLVIALPDCCGNDLGLNVFCEPVIQVWTRNFIPAAPYIELTSFTLFGVTYTPPSPIDITDISALNAYFNSLALEVYVLWVTGLFGEPQIYVFPYACSGTVDPDFFLISVSPETDEALVYASTESCASAQLILPGIICPTCCDCYMALPTGTSDFIDTDIIEYTTDGGATWLPYTYPDCINPADYLPAQEVTFRRTTTFTNGCDPLVVEETINGCTECDIEITGVSIGGLEPCDEFWYYETDDTLPDTADFISITIDGVTYTPPAPIAASDIVALQTYLNSLSYFAKFRVTDSGVGYININMFSGCGDPITGSFVYDDGAGDVTINFTEPEVQLTCEDVQGIIPDFDCNMSCNEDGTVSITVNFNAECTSGANVLVTLSGGLGGGNVPAADGFATFTSIPALGQTVTVTVYDAEILECLDTFEFTLPNCAPDYTIDNNDSSVGCEDDEASMEINVINSGTIDLPMGTVFDLVWTGLPMGATFITLTGGSIAMDGSTFTLDVYDIAVGLNFNFAVEWENIGCETPIAIELTITSADIDVNPLVINLFYP